MTGFLSALHSLIKPPQGQAPLGHQHNFLLQSPFLLIIILTQFIIKNYPTIAIEHEQVISELTAAVGLGVRKDN